MSKLPRQIAGYTRELAEDEAANTMAGVVLATAGYDHTIRFWEAASGTCNRTVKYPDSVGPFRRFPRLFRLRLHPHIASLTASQWR